MSSVKAKDTPAGAVAAAAADAPAEAAVPLDAAKVGQPTKPFLSEGVRIELEHWGKATDPMTGGVFQMDKETGKVTFTDRAGKVTEL